MPSNWSFDTILSASGGTGEEREDTWKQREERMDKEATSVDIDAIDTDMHARAGDAELIPWLLVPDLLSRWWLATVFDTDCLHPLKQTRGCSLWSSGNR